MVRVVQPCGAVGPHRGLLERGLARLERAGCHVRWDPTRGDAEWRDYLAGPDTQRAQELIDGLTEPNVEIVWFARGGSGGGRIVSAVLDAVRHRPPRLLVGFSDATVFLNALAAHLGWVTIHGPVVTALDQPDQFNIDLDALLAVLTGDRRAIEVPATAGFPVEGLLLGGNLSVLASTAGTPAWPKRLDSIWLLEDVAEPLYRIDRMTWTLRAAGLFDGARGLWLGDLGLDGPEEAAAAAIFREDLPDLPVIRGAPAGHRGRLDALPLGARVRLDPGAGRLQPLAPWLAGISVDA